MILLFGARFRPFSLIYTTRAVILPRIVLKKLFDRRMTKSMVPFRKITGIFKY